MDKKKITQQINKIDKIETKLDDFSEQLDNNTSEIEYNNNKIDNVFVNVKFPPPPLRGAAGDGKTDDTLILQNLINNFYI